MCISKDIAEVSRIHPSGNMNVIIAVHLIVMRYFGLNQSGGTQTDVAIPRAILLARQRFTNTFKAVPGPVANT